jgi:hypothetical protein
MAAGSSGRDLKITGQPGGPGAAAGAGDAAAADDAGSHAIAPGTVGPS